MKNEFFFKNFVINSHNCGMPVSTDGVLLGCWARNNHPQNLLDIGTGTGLLALMLAQRFSKTKILAIDIDDEAINAAKKNVEKSLWYNRISVVQANVLHWQTTPELLQNGFDFIICNPPYFNHGEQSINTKRAKARHTDFLPHHALIDAMKNLLNKEGEAHLILPKFEAEQFIQQAEKKSLFCSRLLQIKTTEKKEVSRMLFSLCHKKVQCEKQSLTIQENGKYSQAFIALTKDFYLKF